MPTEEIPHAKPSDYNMDQLAKEHPECIPHVSGCMVGHNAIVDILNKVFKLSKLSTAILIVYIIKEEAPQLLFISNAVDKFVAMITRVALDYSLATISRLFFG